MRTVGVDFHGYILVVGFEVAEGGTNDVFDGRSIGVGEGIDIVEIKRWTRESGTFESPRLANALADNEQFRIRCLLAIADFNGQDFDPQTFRRMN